MNWKGNQEAVAVIQKLINKKGLDQASDTGKNKNLRPKRQTTQYKGKQ